LSSFLTEGLKPDRAECVEASAMNGGVTESMGYSVTPLFRAERIVGRDTRALAPLLGNYHYLNGYYRTNIK